jgi:hypothetical protein
MREWLLGNPNFHPHLQAVVRAGRRHSDDKQAEGRRKSKQIARQRSIDCATICMQLARNLVHIAGHPKRNCTPSSLAETKKADALWSIRL